MEPTEPAGAASARAALDAAELVAVRERLVSSPVPDGTAEREGVLRALEELKAAVSAVQARVVVAVDAAARQADAARGLPVDQRGTGVPTTVALALRESPATARTLLGASKAWVHEMPHTFLAMEAGRLSSWRATVLVKETAHLPVEARAVVDRELCSDPRTLAGVGTQRLAAMARKRAGELDPASSAERSRRAEAERSVSVRPAPDTMTYLTALLPVARGVAVYAALRRAADAAKATGDARSRGQIMADTLVERVTGQATAEAVPVAVNLVISDASLLGAGHEPAVLVGDPGTGTAVVPAQVARNLVAHGLDADAAWVRRLYADPGGSLVATTSTARFFGDGLAAMLRARDQGLCRMPYCDAPVRHLDHVRPAGEQGRTTLINGQGLCEACNHAKNSGVIRQEVVDASADGGADGDGTDGVRGSGGTRHTVVTRTATGSTHTSTAPALPRPAVLRPAAVTAPRGSAATVGITATRETAGTVVATATAGTAGATATRESADTAGVTATRASAGTVGVPTTRASAGTAKVTTTRGSAGTAGVTTTRGSAGTAEVATTRGSAGTAEVAGAVDPSEVVDAAGPPRGAGVVRGRRGAEVRRDRPDRGGPPSRGDSRGTPSVLEELFAARLRAYRSARSDAGVPDRPA